MIGELKIESLVQLLFVDECKDCENSYCYSISNENLNKETFEVHTHSDHYQKHLEKYAELEEQQPLGTNAGPLAGAKQVVYVILDYFVTVSETTLILL